MCSMRIRIHQPHTVKLNWVKACKVLKCILKLWQCPVHDKYSIDIFAVAQMSHPCSCLAVPAAWNILPPGSFCKTDSFSSSKPQLQCYLLREACPDHSSKVASQHFSNAGLSTIALFIICDILLIYSLFTVVSFHMNISFMRGRPCLLFTVLSSEPRTQWHTDYKYWTDERIQVIYDYYTNYKQCYNRYYCS